MNNVSNLITFVVFGYTIIMNTIMIVSGVSLPLILLVTIACICCAFPILSLIDSSDKKVNKN